MSASSRPDWSKDPELYGIRRSGRAPAKHAGSSEDSEEQSSSPAKKKKRRGGSSHSSSGGSESEWSDEPVKKAVKKKPAPKKKSAAKKKRSLSDDDDSDDNNWRTSRSTRGGGGETKGKVDYVVPDTDEDVDEDTVQSWTHEGEEEVDNSPTVEKVLDSRKGEVGATGPATTVYSVEQRGDPNQRGEGGREMQYLIKWKGYSHLHNTWESDTSLVAQTAKGVKKVDNFVKKQDELADWKTVSSPEDIEYMECQLQMQGDLQASYTTVERIVEMLPAQEDGGYPDYYVKWKNLPYSGNGFTIL